MFNITKLEKHHYFCFMCGKQLYALCLGGLICECGKTFIPTIDNEGNSTLVCVNSEKSTSSEAESTSSDNINIETFYVYAWPDDIWVLAEEYDEQEYAYKSDDYAILELGGEGWDEEAIDNHVYKYNRGMLWEI